MTEPCDLSAVEARRLIGARQLSSTELVESCIARIEAVNPSVNAVITKAYDRARDEATAADAAVMRGDALPPLHGLPIGIKDLDDTAGIRTTYGSMLYKDHVPDNDEQVVAAAREAGAIVIGKTNTPEFGAGGNTNNALHGPTRNPSILRSPAAGRRAARLSRWRRTWFRCARARTPAAAYAFPRHSTASWRIAPVPAWFRPVTAISPSPRFRRKGRWRGRSRTRRCYCPHWR